ncbi:MAG: membrane protein insertion efficiency factor YidD [Corynebacterium sp.]|uniref:membrane protein insertion efficiency factor YidD n=1 Tax=Corynebacterium sp. TaxID=1720 RepID=UPI0026DB278A|nr:membrane protein insertion efficiency factor YidD [Corynebacterium sp.]MDO5098595.1 membrane protein insertion efficiency factor YidD [Corynebacterium sp.]
MCKKHLEKSNGAADSSKSTPSLMARALGLMVRGYQKYLSPLKSGPSCRFEPSCSAYALGVIEEYGAFWGLIKTLARLAKCGPWHPGGYDPVIPKSRSDTQRKN